jgi:pyruvate kinase
MAHCSHAFITKFLNTLKTIENGGQCATWIDCNGLKIRTGKLVDKLPVQLVAGSPFLLGNSPEIIGDETKV